MELVVNGINGKGQMIRNYLNRRAFLRTIGSAAISILVPEISLAAGKKFKPSVRQPNIVLCVCDQLRAFEVGCYGNRVIQTPNIDRLAENGILFRLAVTNNPACTPARSGIISGQYSRTCTGSVMNCGEPPAFRRIFPNPTLPEILRQNGYQTALIGKWHIDTRPEMAGFDTALYPNVQHAYRNQTFHTHEGESFTVEDFTPEYEMKQVRTFLETRKTDRPFFLYYNISPPHHPIGSRHMPPEYTGKYTPEAMPLRPNTDVDFDKPFNQGGWFEAVKPGGKDNPRTWRDYYRFWYNVYVNSDFFNAWYSNTPA